jgi:hypothetical protein
MASHFSITSRPYKNRVLPHQLTQPHNYLHAITIPHHKHRRPHTTTPLFKATQNNIPNPTSSSSSTISNLIAILKEDLTHLFEDQGIDPSLYDPQVSFEDPITKYSSLSGYLFNIQMLRRIFSPTFTLHDIKQTNTWEITTRWTMSMKPGVNGVNPFSIIGYEPQLTFTGTSVMGVNPETGRFNSHVDTWDAIDNQRYLSFEAVGHLMNQLGDLKKAPKGLASPLYSVLKKRAMYEIRRYAPFAVAETNMKGQGSGMSIEAQGNAFQALAGYIFGENQGGQKMEMTTPVFNDAQGGKMQFYISPPPLATDSNNDGTISPPTSSSSSSSSSTSTNMSAILPEPTNTSVSTRVVGGGLYAAVSFGGLALPDEAREIELKLRDALSRDGIDVVDSNTDNSGDMDVLIARYNEPWSNPVTRKNEILIKLDEGSFQLW